MAMDRVDRVDLRMLCPDVRKERERVVLRFRGVFAQQPQMLPFPFIDRRGQQRQQKQEEVSDIARPDPLNFAKTDSFIASTA